MGRKHHKSEEIITIARAVRQIAISKKAYFRWRAEYGGPHAVPDRRIHQGRRSCVAILLRSCAWTILRILQQNSRFCCQKRLAWGGSLVAGGTPPA